MGFADLVGGKEIVHEVSVECDGGEAGRGMWNGRKADESIRTDDRQGNRDTQSDLYF